MLQIRMDDSANLQSQWLESCTRFGGLETESSETQNSDSETVWNIVAKVFMGSLQET